MVTVPLHVGGLNFIRQPLVPQVGQQFRRLDVDVPVDDVHELGCPTKVLQVDVVDVSDIGQAVIFRVLHVQDPVDHFPFRDWKQLSRSSKNQNSNNVKHN